MSMIIDVVDVVDLGGWDEKGIGMMILLYKYVTTEHPFLSVGFSGGVDGRQAGRQEGCLIIKQC